MSTNQSGNPRSATNDRPPTVPALTADPPALDHTGRRPIGPTPGMVAQQRMAFDSLWMTISRSGNQDRQFHVRLARHGPANVHGSLRQHDIMRFATIEEYRHRYERQRQMHRELAIIGVPVPPLDESQLLDLGRHVAHILPQAVCAAIIAAVQRARRRRRALRLTLEIAHDARELLSIPWELLALPLGWEGQVEAGEDSFLFLNADITLIRQVRGVGSSMPPVLKRPLRLQVFAATPRHSQPIDVDALSAAIRQVRLSSGMLPHWYSGDDTLGVLQERLRDSNPQIVHLLCHGEQRDVGHALPRYELLFTDANGATHRIGAADLARVLTLAPDLQLVVLQACHAGTTALGNAAYGAHNRQVAEGIALALIRSGVPAVVAMQGAVSQLAAAAFARACYATLAQGGAVDRAVAAGRIAMRTVGGVVDWSLPVVYQGNDQRWYARLSAQLDKMFRRS